MSELTDLHEQVRDLAKRVDALEETQAAHIIHIDELKDANAALQMMLPRILAYVKATAEKVGAVSE